MKSVYGTQENLWVVEQYYNEMLCGIVRKGILEKAAKSHERVLNNDASKGYKYVAKTQASSNSGILNSASMRSSYTTNVSEQFDKFFGVNNG